MAMSVGGTVTTSVLIVDDSEADYVYTRELLLAVSGSRYEMSWVSTYGAALQAIVDGGHDVLLVGYHLGASTGIELLEALRDLGVTIPTIMLTGSVTNELDNEALQSGASDYLVKGQFTSDALARSIRYAIEHRRLLSEMEDIATQDSLTGLANRRHFRAFLHGAIARAERSRRKLGLLFLDLDDFKQVNDNHGHNAGDEVLVGTAGLLSRAIRRGDLVARLGGDEFAMVLDDIESIVNAEGVARKVMDAFRVDVVGKQVGVSMGVAVWPDHAVAIDDLIKAADTAMYQAKLRGRNTYSCFETGMQPTVDRRGELERALELAISRNELSVQYQPQVAGMSGQIVGFEALLRWHRDGGEMVSPVEFIPIAEECGMIDALGEWVLTTACKQFQDWDERGLLPGNMTLAVNVSVHQLKSRRLRETIDKVLQETALRASCLELEITESAALMEVRGAVDEVRALHLHGHRIALDDFGTGHSSLSHLLELPVQTIKIDRSFVQCCVDTERGAAVVIATLALARSLNLTVVAEGVETQEQREFLLKHGCGIMQGFLYHRPKSSSEIEALLRSGAARIHVPSVRLAATG
jgi:diguanylate cyclase (GGDEF)-like protein